MNDLQKRSFGDRFSDCLRGLKFLWTEKMFRFHVGTLILISLLSIVLRISWGDYIVIFVAGLVWLGAEATNTAIEKLCDTLYPDFHQGIGKVKDMAAAIVLLIGGGSMIVWCYILIPYIENLIEWLVIYLTGHFSLFYDHPIPKTVETIAVLDSVTVGLVEVLQSHPCRDHDHEWATWDMKVGDDAIDQTKLKSGEDI